MAWHPCRFWQCVENYGGQCFGSGCSLNPMPEPSEPEAEDGDDENENTQEDGLTMSDDETIADIIKKIRAEADYIEETARGSLKAGENYDGIAYTESDLESALDLAESKRKEADRLEAALSRELSKICPKTGGDFGQLGDASKLREALKAISGLCDSLMPTWDGAIGRIKDITEAALATPARNCDVGTAKEQSERWYWRYHVGHLCQSCPLGPRKWSEVDAGTLCFSEWLQMPYEEGDKAHAAVSIMGRESLSKQCWECANCKEPTAGWDRSKFRCAFLAKDFGTWHYDVPNECPCKGKGWIPEKKEGSAK